MPDTSADFLAAPLLNEVGDVRHGFFTRQGGVSGGIFTSLNCGPGSGDDLAHVAENRRRVAAALGARELRTVYQVHGNSVAVVDSEKPWPTPPQADALVTSLPGVALGILTADCTPVLFADGEGAVVGAAHAGWKGAIGGIVEATVAAMERAGASRSGIRAAIGPCIAQASYEVGPEFEARFAEENPAYAAFFKASARSGHWRFDLPGFVRWKLEEAGVQNVETLAPDTCLEEEQFFSYRRATLRGEGQYGRQISAIMITP